MDLITKAEIFFRLISIEHYGLTWNEAEKITVDTRIDPNDPCKISSNIAFIVGKKLKRSPLEICKEIYEWYKNAT